MGVKNAVLVSHKDDELIAVVLLELLPPALQTLPLEQVVGKGCVAVIGHGLLVWHAQRWCDEMVMGQGARVRQDFACVAVDDAMRDSLWCGRDRWLRLGLGLVPEAISCSRGHHHIRPKS